ncbi:MAG: DUF2845 domain-containing protein [Panacagrimonas sp.]
MSLAGSAQAADSLRCGSRIISVEALAAEVLAACGEPSFRDVFSSREQTAVNEIMESEHWTYNFGSNQLIRILRLRHGTLVDIQSDGYGFPERGPRRCSPSVLVEGLSKYRMVKICGEPVTRRVIRFEPERPRSPGWHHDRRRHPHDDHRVNHFLEPVYREEWVYNFGSRYALKIVLLENGIVRHVMNGEHGFRPR